MSSPLHGRFAAFRCLWETAPPASTDTGTPSTDTPTTGDTTVPPSTVTVSPSTETSTVTQTVTVPTTTVGNYTMEVFDPKVGYTLQADSNLPFVCTGGITSSDWPGQQSYFYEPSGMTTVALSLLRER